MNTTTARVPASRKVTAAKKVDISKLSNRALEALPEDVFLASLRPHARRFALAAFKLKGIR